MRCSVLGDDQKESTVEVLQGCYKHWLRCSGQNPADIVAKLWAVKRDKRCLHKVVQHRALCATEQELTFHNGCCMGQCLVFPSTKPENYEP